MARIEMLRDGEGRSALRWYARKQLRERFQTARGRADPDHRNGAFVVRRCSRTSTPCRDLASYPLLGSVVAGLYRLSYALIHAAVRHSGTWGGSSKHQARGRQGRAAAAQPEKGPVASGARSACCLLPRAGFALCAVRR
jgi:hypothetical protein